MSTCELGLDNRRGGAASEPPRRRRGALRLLDLLAVWHERTRRRRELSRMPDYLLRDMGITRADVDREIHKPFWRG